VIAQIRGTPGKPFNFTTLGLLASIGHRTGVARILHRNFSGFLAWWLWRTIYLSKLPRTEKKIRVALDWTLDLFFSKDFVQYVHHRQFRQAQLIPPIEPPSIRPECAVPPVPPP
jgi:NADH dehydrogenase